MGFKVCCSYFYYFPGRILNRFSKDMGAIDEVLPAAMIDSLQVRSKISVPSVSVNFGRHIKQREVLKGQSFIMNEDGCRMGM